MRLQLRFRPRPGCALLLLAVLAWPRALRAQAAAAVPADTAAHPLVESVTFKGVHAVDEHELAATLATQPTSCKSWILEPLCVLTHSHLFENRHYLNRKELPRDELRIKVYYWLRGYRHTQVSTSVKPSGRGVAVTFTVVEGPPTLVAAVEVTGTRKKLSLKQLRGMGLPRRGQPINLVHLDSLAARAERTLWDRGFGNAAVRDTVLPVESLRVALRVEIELGPRTTVDTVVVRGNRRVTALTIRRLLGLKPGNLYKRSNLLEGQTRLYRSELFRQALINVPKSADSSKDVIVSVREAPLHAARVGGGFNTVDFAQVLGDVTFYNWFGSARRLDLNSAVGNLLAAQLYGLPGFGTPAPPGVSGKPDARFLSPTWQVSASVTQPWLISPLNSLGLTVFAERRSVPFIVVDYGNGASATFTRQLLTNTDLSLTYRFERSRVEAGELYFCVDFGYCRLPTIAALQQWNNLAPLVLTLTADQTNNPLEPRSGYTARGDAEYASAALGSTWRYWRLQGEFSRYLKVGSDILVLHTNMGRVAALPNVGAALHVGPSGNGLLHPRVRFYAGGARSVRGYGQGQLGPRVLSVDPAYLLDAGCTQATIIAGTCNPNGVPSSDFVPRPVGGNSLLEGTIEYRHSFGGNLGGAIFVDAGRVGAGNLPPPYAARSAVTPGFGLRYSSPIGPIRIDLGLRPSAIEPLPVVTQATDSAGQLILVKLATPKRYNPISGAGFLGAITSHLQLHLYIGEGY